jgi:enoyl-CoA hydratase/carnithine racemase
MSQPLELKKDGQIAILFLNRPNVLNAFDLDMLKDFLDYMISFAADDSVRGVVLSGKGRAFCAGADCHDPRRNPILPGRFAA